MYELPVEQKKSMVQANIEAQARKVYAQRLSLEMQKAGGASADTLERTQAQLDAQLAAQLKLEEMLVELV